MKLDLAPPLQPGEPPTAYASRIAAAHGLLARELCSDFGIRHLHLVSGRAPAIAKLAALGDASEIELAHFAFARTSAHGFEHRGQAVRRENLIEGRLDVCPRCLVEDIEHAGSAPFDAAFFCRAEWCLDVVDTCPRHQSALATVHRAPGLAHGMDFSNVLASKIGRLREMAGQAEARAPAGLQDYVLARLEGRESGAPFLDTMELSAAIRTCEMLGTAACFGRKAQCDKLDAVRLRTARIRGFEIGSRGKEGIEELLKSMTDAYSRRHLVEEGGFARQAFAALHNYLHLSPGHKACWKHGAFGPLRTVIVDFIKANFPLKAGDTVLGEVIRERKLHSVSSLAKEIGFGVPRVTKLLRLHGVISSDRAGLRPHNVVFDAAKGAEAVRESLTALPYRGAAMYLGTGRHQVSMLAEANFIQPIESGPLSLRATFAPPCWTPSWRGCSRAPRPCSAGRQITSPFGRPHSGPPARRPTS
ncbi:MAG: TniQ family protein [Xanthobacteraceae bacterium]|nr:TniQ family protein [Xanthobacteraceae bacterium]